VKAVLRLMMLNFADPGRRVLLGLCIVAIAGGFVLQHTVAADLPPARRSMFVMQFMVLTAFIVPWSLIHPRGPIARSWALVPRARPKLLISTALTITLLSLVAALCWVAGTSETVGGMARYLSESLATVPSTFVLLSMFGLQILASASTVPRRIVLGLVSLGGFVVAIVYSMARGLPRITDDATAEGVWLAFAASVLAWVVGGWWFVNRRPVAQVRGGTLREQFEAWRANRLLRQDPVAALLRSRWSANSRWPVLVSWVGISFAPLLTQPRGARDGFIFAAVFFAMFSGMRAMGVTYETVRGARLLWLLRGTRDDLFRTCSRMLTRNTTTIGCCAALVLLATACATGRVSLESNIAGIVAGFSLCVFVPYLAVYLGLYGASLPAPARWRFVNIRLVIFAFVALTPGAYAFAHLAFDATGVLSVYAAITLVSVLVMRRRARRAWRGVDWTFLPAPQQGYAVRLRS
jgi:hypothetical protein